MDAVVRIRLIRVLFSEQEEDALAAFWVTDGIDRCLVGFVDSSTEERKRFLNGRLGQVVEFYEEEEGQETQSCKLALIDSWWANI